MFRFRVTSVVNRCQNTTAAAAVTRLLWSCPGEPDARAGLGSSRVLFCISATFVMAEMRHDNEKGGRKRMAFDFLHEGMGKSCSEQSLRKISLTLVWVIKKMKKKEYSFWDSESVSQSTQEWKTQKVLRAKWPFDLSPNKRDGEGLQLAPLVSI